MSWLMLLNLLLGMKFIRVEFEDILLWFQEREGRRSKIIGFEYFNFCIWISFVVSLLDPPPPPPPALGVTGIVFVRITQFWNLLYNLFLCFSTQYSKCIFPKKSLNIWVGFIFIYSNKPNNIRIYDLFWPPNIKPSRGYWRGGGQSVIRLHKDQLKFSI